MVTNIHEPKIVTRIPVPKILTKIVTKILEPKVLTKMVTNIH